MSDKYKEWDRFANKHGTIFHTSYWLRTMAQWQGLSFDIATEKSNGEIIGGVAYTYAVRYGIRFIQQPIKTMLFSPLGEFHLRQLNRFHKYKFQSLSDNKEDIFTFKADLNDIPKPHRSITKQINKAKRLDYKITSSTGDEDDIIIAWELERLSLQYQGLAPYCDKWDMVDFVQSLGGKAKVFTISYRGIQVASRIVIIDGDTAYDWVAGIDPDFRDKGLNHLLIDYMLTSLKKDVLYFDFGGSGTGGIRTFKERWNFDKQYLMVVKYKSSLFKLTKAIISLTKLNGER